jgi:hypothetical protein
MQNVLKIMRGQWKIFFWISNNSLKKAQRGATLVHRKYTRERLKGARKEIQKIRKGNHSRG